MVYPLRPLPHIPPPREMYRAYLRNLRYVPDPHVWAQLAPKYKKLVRGLGKEILPPEVTPARLEIVDGWRRETSGGARATALGRAGKSEQELWADYARERERRYREIKRAKKDLLQLRAAVACHPHALDRLLKQAYGQTGKIRWELVKNITETSPIPSRDWPKDPPAARTPTRPVYPPTLFQPLPPVLRPLITPYPEQDKRERLKPMPYGRQAHYIKSRWLWDWAECGVPITIPPNPHGTATGWEHLPLEESLKVIAGLTSGPVVGDLPKRLRKDQASDDAPTVLNPRSLPTYAHLRSDLARVFPKYLRIGSPPDAYQKPRPALIRNNSRLWGEPRRLDSRLIRRVYARFLDNLPRVRVSDELENFAYTDTHGEAQVAQREELEVDASWQGKYAIDDHMNVLGTTGPYPEPRTYLQWSKQRPTREDRLAHLSARYVRATEEEREWYARSLSQTAPGWGTRPRKSGLREVSQIPERSTSELRDQAQAENIADPVTQEVVDAASPVAPEIDASPVADVERVLIPTAVPEVPEPKKRGRPRKAETTAAEPGPTTESTPTAPTETATTETKKRGPGRPRKNAEETPTLKKRGRPRKVDTAEPKKRGRPRKDGTS